MHTNTHTYTRTHRVNYNVLCFENSIEPSGINKDILWFGSTILWAVLPKIHKLVTS